METTPLANENIDAVKWFHSHDCDINVNDKKLSFTCHYDSGIGINVFASYSCGALKDVTDYDTW